MITHHIAATLLVAPSNNAPNTTNLQHWLQGIFGPLLLTIISIIAIFFLFTREVTRFVQFLVLAIVIAIVFYFPDSIVSIARGVATALGFKSGT